MKQPHQATKSTDNGLIIRDHATHQTSTNSTLLSLPLELRLMIFVACIKPSWIEGDSRYHYHEPTWYLSHTIPRSTLQLNKQLRIEALTALAGHPGLTVIFNVWPTVSLSSYLRPNADPPTLENTHVEKHTMRDFERVYQQCKSLPALKSRKLTLRLQSMFEIACIPLEVANYWLVDHVSVALEFWPEWDNIFIEVEAIDELLMNPRRKYWMPRPVAELEILCNIAVVDLQPLRARTATMKVGWTGSPVDRILKVLENVGGSGQL